MSALHEAYDDDERRKPWKTLGYRAYSHLLNSHDNFLVFRRFGVLNARLMLALQDHIVILEEKLDKLDSLLSKPEAPDVHNGTFREDPVEERTQLLLDLRTKLKDYSQ